MRRFWDKVERTSNGCWVWNGATHRFGYGWFSLNRKAELAHRVAWELTYGPIPPGHCVCHRCDNPPCVNPDHLFLGTKKDNNHDMLDKGRYRRPYGAAAGNAKLNFDLAQEIRSLYRRGKYGFGALALGKRYGVSHTTIRLIVKGKRYSSPDEIRCFKRKILCNGQESKI